jgi:eukaryotic-like serine/threonine-protein kinase
MPAWRPKFLPSPSPVTQAFSGSRASRRKAPGLLFSWDEPEKRPSNIYVKLIGASEPVRLTNSAEGDFGPAWSPDGRSIAFPQEIWVSDQDGTNQVQITSFGNAWAGSPRWSPDGQRIAFDCNVAGNWDVYVANSQGGRPIRLTRSPAAECRPSWAHDGKWIYFASNRTGTYQIWKIPSNGGEQIQLTKNGGFVASESVDGETLYYSGKGGLWRRPVSGGEEMKFFDTGCSNSFAPTKNGVYFIDGRDGYVKLLDFKGHLIRSIAAVPGQSDDEMSVSPDEQWMIYARGGPAGSELMLVENFR